MFGGTGEMQCVRGADVGSGGSGGSGGEDGFETGHHGLGERQEVNEELLTVIMELLRETRQVFRGIGSFAAFAQENRGDFRPPVPGDGHWSVGLCQ